MWLSKYAQVAPKIIQSPSTIHPDIFIQDLNPLFHMEILVAQTNFYIILSE